MTLADDIFTLNAACITLTISIKVLESVNMQKARQNNTRRCWCGESARLWGGKITFKVNLLPQVCWENTLNIYSNHRTASHECNRLFITEPYSPYRVQVNISGGIFCLCCWQRLGKVFSVVFTIFQFEASSCFTQSLFCLIINSAKS